MASKPHTQPCTSAAQAAASDADIAVWNERAAKMDNEPRQKMLTAESLEFIQSHLFADVPDKKNKTFVDFGGGTGMLASQLLSLNATWTGTVLDTSDGMIHAVRQKAHALNESDGNKRNRLQPILYREEDDALGLDPTLKFDAILACFVMHHQSHPQETLKKLVSHLRMANCQGAEFIVGELEATEMTQNTFNTILGTGGKKQSNSHGDKVVAPSTDGPVHQATADDLKSAATLKHYGFEMEQLIKFVSDAIQAVNGGAKPNLQQSIKRKRLASEVPGKGIFEVDFMWLHVKVE